MITITERFSFDNQVSEGQPHFHVIAAQDLGGTQQAARGWSHRWTREYAERIARELITADSINLSGKADAIEAAIVEYGEDDWCEITSSNVAPGWDAIWIHECLECPVRWFADLSVYGRPWWTPAPPAFAA